MIRSILVAVHDSPAAGTAMKTAARLGQRAGARFHGLFVADPTRFVYVPLTSAFSAPLVGEPPLHVPLPPQELLAEEERLEAEERRLNETFHRICAQEGLTGQFRVARGDVEDSILRCSRWVDLIVMGSRNRTLGTSPIVERVLRRSVRPVVVVPEEARSEGPILFAYDGSRAAQRSLAIGASLLHLTGSRSAHVLTIGTDPDEMAEHQKDAREYLGVYVPEVTAITRDGDPASGILELAEEIQAGTIVLGAFGHSRLRELIFGSTTQQVLDRAKTTVVLSG